MKDDITGRAVAETYVQKRSAKLERYTGRLERQQDRLLSRLVRREKKMLARLQRADSTTVARLSAGTSFDTLRQRTRHGQTSPDARRNADPALDTLRRVLAFAQGQSTRLNVEISGITFPGNERFTVLQDRLSLRAQMSQAVQARLRELKNTGVDKVPGFEGLEKTAFYTNSRLKAWRSVADQPSKLEERALETLQGTNGFSEALTGVQQPGLSGTVGVTSTGVPAGATSPTRLEQLGFQTKRQVQASLQQQFGSNLGVMQQAVGQQVADWQNRLKDAKATLGKARAALGETKASIRESHSIANQLRSLEKPSFRINPMRGLPFYQRLEKGYTLNANRAIGGRPALLEGGVQVTFKHTFSLSYGLGAIASFGLGQDWNHIHLSAEGLGVRAFVQWKGVYGIGAYAGYERIYRLVSWQFPDPGILEKTDSPFRDRVLLGATKTYTISTKVRGEVQLLYDLNQDRAATTSPLIFRVVSKF